MWVIALAFGLVGFKFRFRVFRALGAFEWGCGELSNFFARAKGGKLQAVLGGLKPRKPPSRSFFFFFFFFFLFFFIFIFFIILLFYLFLAGIRVFRFKVEGLGVRGFPEGAEIQSNTLRS